MNFELFIARRLFFHTGGQRQVSRPAVRIALIGISVGLIVMLLAVSIVLGFKHQVEDSVVGVSSHMQVTSYHSNFSYEMVPLTCPDSLPQLLEALPNVRHVQAFTTKPAVIKTADEVQTVVFKGVSNDFDWHFLQQHLLEGSLPDYANEQPSNQVWLSTVIASKLSLKQGDEFIAYFTRDDRIAARKWQVCGLFDTHFQEFDQLFVLADNRMLAKLNGWEPHQIGGLEVFVEDIRNLRQTDNDVYEALFGVGSLHGNAYYVQSVYDLNPELFGWLDLLDMNVWLILLLMLFVAGFNMISGLLILILERTNLIGMLKSMGADNVSLQRVFLYLSAMLIAKGMAWGNLIGLGLCALQYFLHLVPLDASVYYVSYVPVEFNWLYVLLLNVGTLLLSLLMMLLPVRIVSHIVPVKAIRFD